MKYIVLHPGHQPEVIESEKLGLADLQHHVGGLITSAYIESLAHEGIDCYANDEGLLIGEQPNIGYMVGNHPVVLVGGLVFVSHDEEGDTKGLAEDQIEKVKHFLSKARKALPKVLLRASFGI